MGCFTPFKVTLSQLEVQHALLNPEYAVQDMAFCFEFETQFFVP
jgi:hypothetical protein